METPAMRIGMVRIGWRGRKEIDRIYKIWAGLTGLLKIFPVNPEKIL
jgi:hypothetical protein